MPMNPVWQRCMGRCSLRAVVAFSFGLCSLPTLNAYAIEELQPPAQSTAVQPSVSSPAFVPAPPTPEIGPSPSPTQPAAESNTETSALPPSPLPSHNEGPEGGSDPVLNGTIPRLSVSELESLVAPVALYPDKVLDAILDAVQTPQAISQAISARDLTTPDSAPPNDWPASVQFLQREHPTVLTKLDENRLLMTRLGWAVKVQPEDVVTAIRQVRHQAEQLQQQTGTELVTTAPDTSLDVYPCYGYYTNGFPSSNYCVPPYSMGYGYGDLYSYGYSGYPGYGYYGAPILGGVARLTLGILALTNGPYWYSPYYDYPYYGYGYGFWSGYGPGYGYGYWNRPVPYFPPVGPVHPWGWSSFRSVSGPRGNALIAANTTVGTWGTVYRNGVSSGNFYGPRGGGVFEAASRSFGFNNGITAFGGGRGAATLHFAQGRTLDLAGSGIAGRTQFGNTTVFGAAGTLTGLGSGGRGGTASGWLTGQATVVGNSAAWHTQAAGNVTGNAGIRAFGTHTGSGSLIAYADGGHQWSRTAQRTYQGTNRSLQVTHQGAGSLRPGTAGQFDRTTTLQGSNGRGGTISSSLNNGQFDIDITRNQSRNSAATGGNLLSGLRSPAQPTRTGLGDQAANRLSGATGWASRSTTGPVWGENRGYLHSAANTASSQGRMRSQSPENLAGFSRRNLTDGPGWSRPDNPTSRPIANNGRLGERFGGYGNLSPSTGSLGTNNSNLLRSRVEGQTSLRPNFPPQNAGGLSTRLGDRSDTTLSDRLRTGGPGGLSNRLNGSSAPNPANRPNYQQSTTPGSSLSNLPRQGSGLGNSPVPRNMAPSTSFSGRGLNTPSFSGGPNFGGSSPRSSLSGSLPNRSLGSGLPRGGSRPSFGGSSMGGAGRSLGGNIGGGNFGGGNFGGSRAIGGGANLGGGRALGGGAGGGRAGFGGGMGGAGRGGRR